MKDRAVPGHWEGDLIFGKKMTSVGTLVERHSRYVILLKLPTGHGAEAVRKAMTKRILTLPAQLRRSITWDQPAPGDPLSRGAVMDGPVVLAERRPVVPRVGLYRPPRGTDRPTVVWRRQPLRISRPVA